MTHENQTIDNAPSATTTNDTAMTHENQTNTTNAPANTSADYFIGTWTKTQLSFVAKALSKDPHRELLKFAFIDKTPGADQMVIVATDTHRLHAAKTEERYSPAELPGGFLIDLAQIVKLMKPHEKMDLRVINGKVQGSILSKANINRPIPELWLNPDTYTFPPNRYPNYARVVPDVHPADFTFGVQVKYLNDCAEILGVGRLTFNGTAPTRPLIICENGALIGSKEVPANPLYLERINNFAVIMPMATPEVK